MMVKNDPLMMNYLAFYISIVFYRELTPEQAFRLAEGNSNIKPECKDISEDMVVQIDKIVSNKNFKSVDRLEKRFGLSRHTILKLIKEYRNQKLYDNAINI